MKSGYLEKVKHVDEDCFVSPVVITVKSDNSVERFRLTKLERQLYQSPTTHAEYGSTAEPNLGRDKKRPNKRTKHIQNRSRLCLRSNDVIRRNK